MTHTRRLVFAASAFGLLLLASGTVSGNQPLKKARPSRLETELERFRALEPADRMKLVAKLAGAKG